MRRRRHPAHGKQSEHRCEGEMVQNEFRAPIVMWFLPLRVIGTMTLSRRVRSYRKITVGSYGR